VHGVRLQRWIAAAIAADVAERRRCASTSQARFAEVAVKSMPPVVAFAGQERQRRASSSVAVGRGQHAAEAGVALVPVLVDARDRVAAERLDDRRREPGAMIVAVSRCVRLCSTPTESPRSSSPSP
jgi:hypothetical protein